MPELSILPKLSPQQMVVCRPHTLVCNRGDRRSNAQDTAISGERFSPSYAIHLANERRVRPSGDQDEDFAPPISSRPPRQQVDRLPRPDRPLGVRCGPVVPPPPAHVAFSDKTMVPEPFAARSQQDSKTKRACVERWHHILAASI
jgi:hypothetical protein